MEELLVKCTVCPSLVTCWGTPCVTEGADLRRVLAGPVPLTSVGGQLLAESPQLQAWPGMQSRETESPWLMGGAVECHSSCSWKHNQGRIDFVHFFTFNLSHETQTPPFLLQGRPVSSRAGGIEENMGSFLSVQNLGWGLDLKEPCLVSTGGYGEVESICVCMCKVGGRGGQPLLHHVL